MHVLLPAEDGLDPLRAELGRVFPDAHLESAAENLLLLKTRAPAPAPFPALFFARQLLPDARLVAAASIRSLADALFEALVPALPEGQPWRLHVDPNYGQGEAGKHRCHLIVEALRDRPQ